MGHHSNKCHKKVPHGITLKGYGKASTHKANTISHCKVYNDQGEKLGYVESYYVNIPNATGHHFCLEDGGSLDVQFSTTADIVTQQSINSATIAAFPELEPYAANTNAVILISSGNHHKKDNGTFAWKAKGSLSDANYLEVRSVFLVFIETDGPHYQRCLGCNWFIGRE